MNDAKLRTGIVILIVLVGVGIQAEIKNEKIHGACTVFDHIDNFDDELVIFMGCLPRDWDETIKEKGITALSKQIY